MTLTNDEFSLIWKGLDEDGAVGLEAAVEALCASRERAAAEKAWDEGHHTPRLRHSAGIEWVYSDAPNPYRAGEIRNGN